MQQLASSGTEAVDTIVWLLSDEEESVRDAALLAANKIGKEAVPGLIQTVQTGDYDNPNKAAHALGAIGPDARFG